MGGTVWKEAGADMSRVEEARRTAREGGNSEGGGQAGRAGCGGTGVGWVQVHEDKGQG